MTVILSHAVRERLTKAPSFSCVVVDPIDSFAIRQLSFLLDPAELWMTSSYLQNDSFHTIFLGDATLAKKYPSFLLFISRIMSQFLEFPKQSNLVWKPSSLDLK